MPEYKIMARMIQPDGSMSPEQQVAGPFWDHRIAEEAVANMLASGRWTDIKITGA